MRKLTAKLTKIPPHSFFSQNEIDGTKAAALAKHMSDGGGIPPVVAVKYGDEHMPIDGHHRLYAASLLGLTIDGWVVSGAKFETLDQQCRAAGVKQRAEDLVLCSGVPALKVASLNLAQGSDRG